jgi:hypothetical protein
MGQYGAFEMRLTLRWKPCTQDQLKEANFTWNIETHEFESRNLVPACTMHKNPDGIRRLLAALDSARHLAGIQVQRRASEAQRQAFGGPRTDEDCTRRGFPELSRSSAAGASSSAAGADPGWSIVTPGRSVPCYV